DWLCRRNGRDEQRHAQCRHEQQELRATYGGAWLTSFNIAHALVLPHISSRPTTRCVAGRDCWRLGQTERTNYSPNCLKKSLPLSSTRMNAGKFSTSIFQTASIPSSAKSMHSTFLMFSSASTAAGPPIDPR